MHQVLLRICALLEHNSIIVALDDSVVFYELMELFHFTGFFLLVGSIAILDLRTMGVASRKQGLADLAKQLFPWIWLGLLLAFASGFFMFAGDATDFALASLFRVKLLVIALAIIFGLIIQRNAPRWGRMEAIPFGAKLLAFVSLVLWLGAILAAVEVPALSGVG
jgi:hypothetical protein